MRKDIYDGYVITSDGVLISKRLGTPMKTTLSRSSKGLGGGYPQTNVRYEGRHICVRIHRLVAQAFIQNPDDLPEVNHINGIKTDNRMSNLEWSDKSDNILHADRTGLRNLRETNAGANHVRSKQIRCIDNDTIYSSAGEAARELGLTEAARKNITNVCKGRRKVAGGYRWEHV